MGFSFNQSNFDELGNRMRKVIEGIENPDPLKAAVGTGLANLWRKNIDDGPTQRWADGPSLRAKKQSGTTLRNTSLMYSSIVGLQVGPDEVMVGSALTVGRGYNLLALHEFGVDAWVPVRPFLRRNPKGNVYGKLNGKRKKIAEGFTWVKGAFGDGFLRHQRLPKRPTSPFDWDNEAMTPEGDALIHKFFDDYTATFL